MLISPVAKGIGGAAVVGSGITGVVFLTTSKSSPSTSIEPKSAKLEEGSKVILDSTVKGTNVRVEGRVEIFEDGELGKQEVIVTESGAKVTRNGDLISGQVVDTKDEVKTCNTLWSEYEKMDNGPERQKKLNEYTKCLFPRKK